METPISPTMGRILLLLSLGCMMKLSYSYGADKLQPNQSISVGQTLTSPGHDFEMGFFSPGNSKYRYLGIRYTATPDVVPWVANRNSQISVSEIVSFSICSNGTLVISGGDGNSIWSANPSVAVSNPILQLLDDGNMVLVNESSNRYLWQSFDYPTDTLLPGMKLVDDVDGGVFKYLISWKTLDDPSPGDTVLKIENRGLPETVVYKGNAKVMRIGKWNGLHFGGYPRFPNSFYKGDLVFRGERLLSLANLPDDDRTILRRGKVQTFGVGQSFTMNAKRDKWNLAYTMPGDHCDEYGLCGPNGVCNSDKINRCQCFKGFAPKFQREWNHLDWTGGCTRITPLKCNNGDGFQEVRGVKYPDTLKFWLNISMSLDECRAECLRNCNCTAYANAYVTDGGTGCIMWFGDLIDTRYLPEAHSRQNVYLRLPISELSAYSRSDLEKKKKGSTWLIIISIATGIVISGVINGGIFMMKRPKKQAIKKVDEDLELPLFKFATVMAATNNFSDKNIIGEGGFGPVYKGILESKEEIAIKRLSRTSRQGVEEFKNEAICIGKLQHKNLVRLLGCCIEGEERMLIYEYLPNKSLDYFVFDQNQRKLLTWHNRFHIVMGITRGLLYLHHDSRLTIIHRDLKTSNILLDENLNAKISDFGLARTFGEDQLLARTRRVAGTYGYMSPEYAMAGKISVKSDVFSLGVLMLEIVSGKKNRGFECNGDHFHSLLGHAWLMWKENKSIELMDACLKDTFVESEVKRCIHVGLLCVQKLADDRPYMSSVLFMLGNDGAVLPEPKEPGFFVGRGSTPEKSVISPISERNTITITDLEGR